MPEPDRIDPRVLGQRIAEARQARGKTQDEVAEFLGCGRPSYIAVEQRGACRLNDRLCRRPTSLVAHPSSMPHQSPATCGTKSPTAWPRTTVKCRFPSARLTSGSRTSSICSMRSVICIDARAEPFSADRAADARLADILDPPAARCWHSCGMTIPCFAPQSRHSSLRAAPNLSFNGGQWSNGRPRGTITPLW